MPPYGTCTTWHATATGGPSCWWRRSFTPTTPTSPGPSGGTSTTTMPSICRRPRRTSRSRTSSASATASAPTPWDTPRRSAATARHGYYANTSYFDSWLGRLTDALAEVGELDCTVVIATSDHGDMLGDRGTWFKMSFYERSARVPLVVAGPDVANGTVGNACSLLDLFPTLLDVAGAEPAAPLAGRSLWESATGGDDPIDETTGEYMAEMTSHPMFMIRRGRHKYIACETDPPLLYDVEADPLERHNLAGDADHAALAAGFAADVAKRWDSAAIREAVLASQRARRVLYEAMNAGGRHAWDYAPVRDAANEYVRNHMDWAEAGPRSRFPPIV